MDAARKQRMFDLLVQLGVKEIEVGFPSASKTDFEFVRKLVEEDLIPGRHDDRRADAGAARADRAHLRGDRGRAARDRAPLQLDLDDAAARRLPARQGRDHRPRRPRRRRSARSSPRRRTTEIMFEYSPESFHGTELDYALEICEAVMADVGADARREDDRQPADDGRGVPAERLRRPARVVPAARLGARPASSSASTRTTTAAPPSRPPSSA